MLEEPDNSEYFATVLGKVNSLYNTAKTSHPILQTSLDTIEPIFLPLKHGLSVCGEALKSRSQSFSLLEKKQFYVAAVKAWLQEHREFDEFLAMVKTFYEFQWKDHLTAQARAFYSKSLLYEKPKELMLLIADVLCEGYDTLSSALINIYKSKATESDMIERLKVFLGDKWEETFTEKAIIFQYVNGFRERLAKGKGWAEDWLVAAKDSADKTTVLILNRAGSLYNWAVDTLDTNVVTVYTSIPPQPDARGTQKLINMAYRIYVDIAAYTKADQRTDALVKKFCPDLIVKLDNDQDGLVSLKDCTLVVWEIVNPKNARKNFAEFQQWYRGKKEIKSE